MNSSIQGISVNRAAVSAGDFLPPWARGIRIPFNRPSFLGNERVYLEKALELGWIAGGGYFTLQCQSLLEEHLPGSRVFLTTSGTAALEMAALLSDVRPGDRFIAPSFTFSSTVNAFLLRGAVPLFGDIQPDTLNLDPESVQRLLSEHPDRHRIRAIIVVHYGGISARMEAFQALAQEYGIRVIEDNAHGLFGQYRGIPLGQWSSLAALSFHETKNLTCGEGGALIVNDSSLTERAEIVREKGTDRSRFFRGEVSKYQWQDVGSSYAPADLLAALLLAQLEKRELIQSRRKVLWERYMKELGPWAMEQGIRLPIIPSDCLPSYHLFYLLFPSPQERQAFVGHLRARGILACSHYEPLHLCPKGRELGGKEGDCPVTEWVSPRLVRLPLYYGLSDLEQEEILEVVRAWSGVSQKRNVR
ncbi:dTDP-4-amino-4,6-dideoxygalactose transaminase [Candidatus Methylacidithermus pantelleriae]|nr:dTDP-4-amino-4,6-dideoxygalactose transaminase [Candidatus Methylacidithermus pantelleriae]